MMANIYIVLVLMISLFASGCGGGSVPKCDAKEVHSLLSQILGKSDVE